MHRRNFVRSLFGAAIAPIWRWFQSDSSSHGSEEDTNPPTAVTRFAEDQFTRRFSIGRTGSGKTTTLKNALIRQHKAGEDIVFIDPKGDRSSF